jgi:hypothetical protein
VVADNMIACGVGCVLVRLMGRMGLVYGNLLGRVERSSLDTLDEGWIQVVFGMIYGVKSSPLR